MGTRKVDPNKYVQFDFKRESAADEMSAKLSRLGIRHFLGIDEADMNIIMVWGMTKTQVKAAIRKLETT